MPLPDERPRQSVANLIGRFEQQGKRQAAPALPVVSRSASVSSQIAGDAVKEDVKDRREWPPKPVTSASADIKPFASSLSSSSSPRMSNSPPVAPQPIPDFPPPPDVPTTPTPVSPEPAKSSPKPKAVATGKFTPTSGSRRAVASPAKSRSSATKPSTSSPPPPKTSLQSSVSQPLRPQHTGHSVTSNPSTRQSRPVPRTAPSTPSRPKSSPSQHQPVSRPKTPSSGLFAPTAASLARSRNAPPPPPPPVKKATLSSDAAERLSKPTAASLSKARAPVPTAPGPARVAKSTSAGAHGLPAPRGLSKPKVGRIPSKPKEVDAEQGTQSNPPSVSSEPSRDPDQLVADHRIENGHESVVATFSDAVSPEDAPHGYAEDQDVHVNPDPDVHPDREAGDHPAEEVHGPEHDVQDLGEQEAVAHEREHEQIYLEVHDDAVPAEPAQAESHASEVTSNGDSSKFELAASGSEIEDIVNMLEGSSFSKPRPQSIVSIPDENPDEY